MVETEQGLPVLEWCTGLGKHISKYHENHEIGVNPLCTQGEHL